MLRRCSFPWIPDGPRGTLGTSSGGYRGPDGVHSPILLLSVLPTVCSKVVYILFTILELKSGTSLPVLLLHC